MSIQLLDDDDDVTMDDDIAGKAFASITAHMQSYTSDKVGATQSSPAGNDDLDNDDLYYYDYLENKNDRRSNLYEVDAMDWMTEELEQEEEMEELAPLATPKRTPLLERADTPVMSNSSKKKKKKKLLLLQQQKQREGLLSSRRRIAQDDDDDHDHDHDHDDGHDNNNSNRESAPTPVKSPYPITTTTTTTTTTTNTEASTSYGLTLSSAARGTQRGSVSHHYRRYHDALLTYLRARRSLSDRLEMELQDQALVVAGAGTIKDTPSSLASQECRVELDFLRSLNHLCWNSLASKEQQQQQQQQQEQQQRQNLKEEGNLWMLLFKLRKLGLTALVWDNTAASQNYHAQIKYLQKLAIEIEKTPRELMSALSSDDQGVPLIIRRRNQLLKWMEACLEQDVVEPKTSRTRQGLSFSNQQVTHPDDDDKYNYSSAPSLIGESHPDKDLLHSCLSFVLAGQLEQASARARTCGQPWRAAVWSGGAPYGFDKIPNEKTEKIDRIQVGNPHRFLWKRQTWNNGKHFASHNRPQEAAIASLLANDMESCLSNPCLRTWEQGLYCILYSMWGAMEDQVLHLYNNYGRQRRPPHPGTNELKQEQEQLSATMRFMTMSESQAIQTLSASPYEEMRGSSSYQSAAAALVEGANAISDFFDLETEACLKSLQEEESKYDMDRLRFLTHLSLYLDSLSSCTTPLELEGIRDNKNQLLFHYVQHLASRPYLWHMVALYASLLPESTLLKYYPNILVQVQADHERKAMLDQARELFPRQGLDLQVLRQVVRLILSPNDDDEDEVQRSDVQKCRAIKWLLYHDEHMGDALICANMLLRDFFLNQDDDKMESAIVFVNEYLPDDLLDQAGGTAPIVDDGVHPDLYKAKVGNALSEHRAFVSYLNAYQMFGDWKDVLSTTTSATATSAPLESRGLNTAEAKIDQEMRLRVWIKDKKAKSQAVIDAANQARSALHTVLTHPGGWLCIDDEDEFEEDDREEETRQREIQRIRSRYLVLAVDLYHEVCAETASWMSRSLDDGIIGTRKASLQTLVGEDAASLEKSPYSPNYWYEKALDLAVLVADDRHGVHKAFASNELQEFLSKLAETAVSKLIDKI